MGSQSQTRLTKQQQQALLEARGDVDLVTNCPREISTLRGLLSTPGSPLLCICLFGLSVTIHMGKGSKFKTRTIPDFRGGPEFGSTLPVQGAQV